ncbi:nicotinate-nucleotide adenylyltransferase [Clostridium sp. cel8]|jgi:nicotinate-nucleotide adenylyltransferase|uniref:nicotinate-nucleotide adenylyltransferase n=1 Tax=unclassified Clostridium TaxID=2614128 RepID=UPI0015F43C69|nr:nicotinate-nucleotide adenylyltransferase [Clostridium sp. cel8]MBA5849911.1 nicotinate-nucleotide adenylyltransferase [Clostridium sp. cel8]
MIKKAIFGGTFDPLHNGHIHIAYEALYKLNLDEVIFMPSGNPPHKMENEVTDASLRYNMVKKAVEKEDKFKVSCYEMKDNSVSYTYKTLAHFNKVDKNVEWYFLTGVDCLMDVEEWNNPSGIFKLCKFIVFNRPGFSKESIENQKIYIENKYSADIIFLDAPLLDISSTSIRENIRIGRNVSYLLPESVYDIIKKYNLYR